MTSGFVIPRATPSDVILRNLPLDGRDAKELFGDLHSCKGSSDFDLRTTEIEAIESVSNTKFLRRFSERRNELKADGSTVRESYAFVVVPSHESVVNAIDNASIDPSLIDTSGLSFLLGDPTMGVHVFKTAQSALLHYGRCRHFVDFSLILIKVLVARGNLVKAQPSHGGCLLEPQPAYDHHLTRDVIGTSNELLYIFEYDSEAEIVPSPRAILPIAIFQYKLTHGPFKRTTHNQQLIQRRPKNDSGRVAAIIKMKKQQVLAEEARRMDAEKIIMNYGQSMDTMNHGHMDPLPMNHGHIDNVSVENSPIVIDLDSPNCLQHVITITSNDSTTSLNDDVEMEGEGYMNGDEEHYIHFRGPQLVPVCADIFQCGYDHEKSLCENRQALALSNSSGVAVNVKTIHALRRSGRAYCKEKKTAEINSLVQICRQLPPESQISAAFHLTIGFLRYQLGDRSVQVELPNVDTEVCHKNKLSSSVTHNGIKSTANVSVQCDHIEEVSSTDGPTPVFPKNSAIVTTSVMIQCNLSNRSQIPLKRHSNTRPNGSFGNRSNQFNSLPDPHRPQWAGQNKPNVSPDHSAVTRSTKPPVISLDDQFNGQNDESENDDHFVLRLIVEAITEGTKRRPSNALLDRLEKAFFQFLNRSEGDAERDRILLDLANYSQQGRWQICLEKLGVSQNLFSAPNQAEESVSRSRNAGQMWAQTLVQTRPSDELNSNISRRKISRYADNIFDDSPRDHQVVAPVSDRRRQLPNNPLQVDKSFMISQQLQQQQRTLSRASVLHLRDVLFQRKTEDIATVLRAVNSRQGNRFDEFSLYSQLLNLRKPFP